MTTPSHHLQIRSLLATVAVAIPAMLISSGLSAPSAQAAYIVTLDQVGTNVVATGSGTIDLIGLNLANSNASGAFIVPSAGDIINGPAGGVNDDRYAGFAGPTSFGGGALNSASGGTGDRVGVDETLGQLFVPRGYMSGTFLSDTTTFGGSFATLGVTPGTYVWTWGSGADADSFTLQIGPAVVPAPLIDRGLPVLLAVGGLLFGAKLFERGKRRRLQLG